MLQWYPIGPSICSLGECTQFFSKKPQDRHHFAKMSDFSQNPVRDLEILLEIWESCWRFGNPGNHIRPEWCVTSVHSDVISATSDQYDVWGFHIIPVWCRQRQHQSGVMSFHRPHHSNVMFFKQHHSGVMFFKQHHSEVMSPQHHSSVMWKIKHHSGVMSLKQHQSVVMWPPYISPKWSGKSNIRLEWCVLL